MSERHQDIAKTSTWAVDRLAERIGQEPKTTGSPRNGDGLLYSIPAPSEHLPRTIAFFEQEQVVTVDTANVHIEIYSAAPPRPTKDGVIVDDEAQTARLLFLRDGHIALEVYPPIAPEPLESRMGIPDTQSTPIIDSDENSIPSASGDDLGASGDASKTEQPVRTEIQPKKRWTGYVAADPLFATSTDGTPRVNLIVSEHLEDDQTVYHKVYTTKREAARLKDLGIAKGSRVRVEAYEQPRERKNRDGTTTPETRFYAVHLKVYEKGDPDASASPVSSADES